MMLASDPGISEAAAVQWAAGQLQARREALVLEEPLAIEIAYERGGAPVRRLIATTMRTPGADEELATGFLYAEGLIAGPDDIGGFASAGRSSRGDQIATLMATLRAAPREGLERVSRSLLTSSACGLCGRPTLQGLRPSAVDGRSAVRWDPHVLAGLPGRLQGRQPLFTATGGSHGAGLAALDGTIVLAREDVGRHNAVDKLIGAALAQPHFSFAEHALVLSGRASFELAQKAAAAGVPVVIAVGAPSSLAVRLAAEAGQTLIGFTREGRFTVYTGAWRLDGHGIA